MTTLDKKPFTLEELRAWGGYTGHYFIDVLNGETSVEEAREDLASFRNSNSYTGDDPEFMEIKDE